jgi:uncharacterized OB-fold protein
MQQPIALPLKPATSYIRLGEDSRPYLEGYKCDECGAVFLGIREACGRCGTRGRMNAVRLGERGRLYSYTIVYRSYPGIKVPFISAIADLEGGGTVKANLLNVQPDSTNIQFGMPIKVVFQGADIVSADGAGYVVHFFVPAEESSDE